MDPGNFEKFLNIKLWVPKRLKEKLGHEQEAQKKKTRNKSRSLSPGL